MEQSSGILAYRVKDGIVQVLLGKNGGPRYSKRDKGCWNIPKGHVEANEELFDTAMREFGEETSLRFGDGTVESNFRYLGSTKTAAGKHVHIFAVDYDFSKDGDDPVWIKSNLCETEWPPHSGRKIKIPELSKARYFNIDEAYEYIFKYQRVFLDRLKEYLKIG